jgi:hypothetical protein
VDGETFEQVARLDAATLVRAMADAGGPSVEFKTEAAHRVIDTGRPIAQVAGELSVAEASLAGGCAMSVGGWRPWQGPRTSR